MYGFCFSWFVFFAQSKIFFFLLFYNFSPRLSFSLSRYLLFSLSQFSRSVKTVHEPQQWLGVLNVLTMIIQKLLLSFWSLPVCLSFFYVETCGCLNAKADASAHPLFMGSACVCLHEYVLCYSNVIFWKNGMGLCCCHGSLLMDLLAVSPVALFLRPHPVYL